MVLKRLARILALALLFSISGWTQGTFPFIIGGQLESGIGILPNGNSGSGLLRVTPFLGAWLQGLGYAKVGLSYWKYSKTDALDSSWSVRERDVSLQLGISYGAINRPYFIGSFTRAKQLSDLGDTDWNEWGLGLGAFYSLATSSALMFEAEYRWITDHYDPIQERETSGTRMQMNLGFVVYFY
ncbi:MAG TPA: hypothetical protein VLM37_06125 [Fibrobacteraceae bacterium]|nr:hypothetical protein [Fibrobacteraceae bacterium]